MNDKYSVLVKVIDVLSKDDIWWVLGGRTGLIIRSVNIEDDNEIDICTTQENLEKIESILKTYCIKSVFLDESPFFTSYVAEFNIDGIKVDVMGDPKKKMNDGTWLSLPAENIIKYKFKNNEINVFTLKSEFEYYTNTSVEKSKRKFIAEEIQKVLVQKSPPNP